MNVIRCGVFLTFCALASCASVPTSNPVAEPTPALPLLSDLDLGETIQTVPIAAAPSPTSGGLLDRLLGNAPDAPPAGVETALAEAVGETPQQTDTAVAEQATVDAPQQAPAPRGLFGRIFTAGTGVSSGAPDTTPTNQTPPNTIIAFGDIGVTCGLSRRDLGTQIAAASGYTVYDTIPNSTAPRPHYITGFRDGCARQFTAALVLLGDVGTHEVVRYSRTRVDLPYSATDNAYEAIKTSFCRTGFGQPCGARLERLANRTTFVTAYERFGAAPVWAEFLLHDGDVAAGTLEGG